MWLKFVVVGLRLGPKSKTTEVFLSSDVNACPSFTVSNQSLAAFSFPLGPDSQTPKDRMAPEEYMFTLTQGDGSRVQGFCRRFLPPAPRVGSKLRYPQVLCLVCQASWNSFFFKVLEVLEQLLRQTDLLLDPSIKELPAKTYAGMFLKELGQALAGEPALGSVLRLPLPHAPTPLSVSPPKRVGMGQDTMPLACTEEYLELQVPPDSGNGAHNAGVSLARLLWHVPVPAMVTLIASLLMERRVVVVGQSRDMVSAAVCAAAALIYPFKWHHIYLPLLPVSFKDYLTAPMPFLIGLPAQLLPALKGIPMDEVTMIDLDLQKCEPAPGSTADDAHRLPWREMLEGALHAAFSLLRSPTEQESNPLIASIMQGYFLKLLGNYRTHIYPEGCGPPQVGAPSPIPHSPHSGRSTPGVRGDAIVGPDGYWFDQAGLVNCHRRNERARTLLEQFRQSQMFEVFIQERLAVAAADKEFESIDEPFEQRVTAYMDNRNRRMAARLSAGMRSSLSRFSAYVKKHRRSDRLGEAELARLKQLAGAFASGLGGTMRRIGSEGSLGASQLWGNILGNGSAQLDQQGRDGEVLDPSAFFEDEEEEIEEAEALAANQASSTGRFSRTGSANSLKDLATTSAGLSAAAGGGGGTSNGGSGGVLGLRAPSNSISPASASLGRISAPAGTGRSSSQPQQQQQILLSLRGPTTGATAAGTVAGAAAVAPLIDLDTSPLKQRPSSSTGSKDAGTAGSSGGSKETRRQQQQQQQQQVSSLVSGHSRSHSAIPAFLYNSSNSSSSSTPAGSQGGSNSIGGTRPSVLHVRTALAAIPAGPLPLPPQPRNTLHANAQARAGAPSAGAGASSGMMIPSSTKGGAAPLPPPPAAAALGLEKKVALVAADSWPVSSPVSTSSSSSSYIGVGTPATAGPADDCWDPFSELVMERRVSVSECGHSGRASAPSSGSGSSSSRGYYSTAGEGSRQLQDSRGVATLQDAVGAGRGASSGSVDGFAALASEPKQQSRLGRWASSQDGHQQQQQRPDLGDLLGTAAGYGASHGLASPHDFGAISAFTQQQQQQEVLVGGGLPQLQRSLSLLD